MKRDTLVKEPMEPRPFGELFRAYRFHRSLTVRDLAPQIGISAATLSRLERGHEPDGETMLKVLAWMFGHKLEPRAAPRAIGKER